MNDLLKYIMVQVQYTLNKKEPYFYGSFFMRGRWDLNPQPLT